MISALLRAMRGRPPSTTSTGDPDEDSPAFIRGLALGAFVGAAIAGSTLWRRFHGRTAGAGTRPDSTTGTSASE